MVTGGLSHVPGGLAVEDGARAMIYPERNGVDSFIAPAFSLLTFREINMLAFSSNGMYNEVGCFGS